MDRPTCVNHGCNQPVQCSGHRWRPFCWRCHRANHGAAQLKEGVTPFKTGKCSNQDGHLGFACPIDYESAPWVIGQTQVDHIDGDFMNNTVENCAELCDMCHTRKGKENGDYKRQPNRGKNKSSAEVCEFVNNPKPAGLDSLFVNVL